MRQIYLACAATALAITQLLHANPPATAPPAPQPMATSLLDDLQRRLNSADPAERATAQKELAGIGDLWLQPDMLLKLADAVSDPELRGIFRQRADLLTARTSERNAMNLPAISIPLKNGHMPELATALNTALDTTIFKPNTNGQPGVFNIDAAGKPLWNLFQTLQEQQPFSLQSSGNNSLALTAGTPGVRQFSISGPSILYAGTLTTRRNINLQKPDAPTRSFNANLTMFMDPRVPLLRVASFKVIKAQDELGHDLQPQSGGTGNAPSNMFTQNVTLTPPDAMGKMMSLSCDVTATIQTAASEVKIDDLQHNLDKPITIGGRSIHFTQFDIKIPQIAIDATVAQLPPEAGGARGPVAGNGTNRLTYRLIDAAGKVAWTYSSAGNIKLTVTDALPSTPPYQLQISAVKQTQDLNLHFDLQNIPIP